MSSTVLGLANSYGPIDTLPAADVLALVAALDWLAGLPLSKSLMGLTSPITLTSDEYNTVRINFTGVLTGNVVVEFPTYRRWSVTHSATGGFTITCKVSGLTGITLQPGETALLAGNGTDIVRAGASAGPNADITSLTGLTGALSWSGTVPQVGRNSVAISDANTTLSGTQYNKPILEITGALTANRDIILPNTAGGFLWVANLTSGGFSLTFKVTGLTGVTVANGKRAQIYGNGTDWVRLTADV